MSSRIGPFATISPYQPVPQNVPSAVVPMAPRNSGPGEFTLELVPPSSAAAAVAHSREGVPEFPADVWRTVLEYLEVPGKFSVDWLSLVRLGEDPQWRALAEATALLVNDIMRKTPGLPSSCRAQMASMVERHGLTAATSLAFAQALSFVILTAEGRNNPRPNVAPRPARPVIAPEPQRPIVSKPPDAAEFEGLCDLVWKFMSSSPDIRRCAEAFACRPSNELSCEGERISEGPGHPSQFYSTPQYRDCVAPVIQTCLSSHGVDPQELREYHELVKNQTQQYHEDHAHWKTTKERSEIEWRLAMTDWQKQDDALAAHNARHSGTLAVSSIVSPVVVFFAIKILAKMFRGLAPFCEGSALPHLYQQDVNEARQNIRDRTRTVLTARRELFAAIKEHSVARVQQVLLKFPDAAHWTNNESTAQEAASTALATDPGNPNAIKVLASLVETTV